MTKAIINGRLVDKSQAVIPIDDKGYFFDFSVYSSLKVVQGKLFFPEYHAARLLESAKIIGLNHPFNEKQIHQWLDKLVVADKLDNAFIRIVLVGDPDDKAEAKLYIFAVGLLTFYSDKQYSRGVKVVTYKGQRLLPTAKTKDLLLSGLAFREAKAKGALEALLVDIDGNIREGTRTNFYAIRGDQLITPPVNKVLSGIAQQIILDVSKGSFEIVRDDIPLKNLSDYDEFFMSNTSMNVMPINQIDDFRLKTDLTKTKTIQKLFKDYYHKNVLN